MTGKYTYYTGYVRVPDTEVAICQVQGAWSKMVPVCLKPGRQVIGPSVAVQTVSDSRRPLFLVF